MKEYEEQVDKEQWRGSVRGFDDDAGYAERYHNSIHGQNLWARKLLSAAFGMVLIFVLTFGLLTGWFREMLLALICISIIWGVVRAWKKITGMRRQNRLHEEAFQRQQGIDGRFGRLGAERKK